MKGLGPNTEFFPVIGHDHESVALRRAKPGKELYSIFGPAERDQIAEPLAPREHAHKTILFFREVIAVQLIIVQAGHLEMEIVDHHMADPCRGNKLRHMRLPDPLRKPHALRIVTDLSIDISRKRTNLANLVVIV